MIEMIPLINQLPAQFQTAALVVLLVITFVVAFKIMTMVLETIIVSVLSGVFYIALGSVLGYSTSLNLMLFYAFLGATLYMGYSVLSSAYGIASTIIEIPYKALRLLFVPFRKLYSHHKEKKKLEKYRRDTNEKAENDKDSDKNTKEVVLDKVTKKEDDE
ncbi:MAG: hypothetical protein H8Z69_00990 [Nanohaloarchaea archaeon]|nr:hypothetical protein [Candidatus Nanohaloarchaea archaeon]